MVCTKVRNFGLLTKKSATLHNEAEQDIVKAQKGYGGIWLFSYRGRGATLKNFFFIFLQLCDNFTKFSTASFALCYRKNVVPPKAIATLQIRVKKAITSQH